MLNVLVCNQFCISLYINRCLYSKSCQESLFLTFFSSILTHYSATKGKCQGMCPCQVFCGKKVLKWHCGGLYPNTSLEKRWIKCVGHVSMTTISWRHIGILTAIVLYTSLTTRYQFSLTYHLVIQLRTDRHDQNKLLLHLFFLVTKMLSPAYMVNILKRSNSDYTCALIKRSEILS